MSTAIFATATVVSAGLMFFAGWLARGAAQRIERSLILAALQNARREAGRLGSRIGSQRRAQRKLREEIKLLSKGSAPITTSPSARPNLPH